MAFKLIVLTGAVLALQSLANDSSLGAVPSTISEHRSSSAQPIMDEAALQEAVQIKEASRPTDHAAHNYLQTKAEPKAERKVKALEAALDEPEIEEEVPAKKNLRASTKVAVKAPSDGPDLAKMMDPAAWKTNSSSGTSEMEKQLTDLMMGAGAGGVAGTPFGKSVGEISRVIKEEMMAAVKKAHEANQQQLKDEVKAIGECRSTKNGQVKLANVKRDTYVKSSGLHKTCRAAEAGKFTEKTETFNEMNDKEKIMKLKCHEYDMVSKQYANQQANGEITQKQGSEQPESYIRRITSTMCGKSHTVGMGGAGVDGFLDLYLIAKQGCQVATREYKKEKKAYEDVLEEYNNKQAECDSLQDQMDGSSCKRATEMKDACEAYAECYFDRKKAHLATVKMVKTEEEDRKAEWRGLNRMKCLMEAFSDGKVKNKEIKACKNQVHDTSKFIIFYPPYNVLDACAVPNLYPSTPQYKLAEFAPLPAYAKGREDANECTGVIEINEVPAKGSPKGCKCERVTLNGPYSAGPLVKCTNCKVARRSQEATSCPDGTKLFSPRSESDWKTVLSSTEASNLVDEATNATLHLIVDVTNSKAGCGFCNKKAMNSDTPQGTKWHTSDGSPWWLRSTTYKEPNKDGQANCYLGVNLNDNEKDITFSYDGCQHHAKTYYCQLKEQSIVPKQGSPEACKCKPVVLTGRYSAGSLMKCTNCLDVYKSKQKNSCPIGTKIFSPANAADWKTFLASAKPLRSPHWIIDVTRPQNGCGGCKNHVMNSKVAAQSTWRTADSSAWWLRNSQYSEPSGDYKANCYMDLWKTPFSETSIMFNDGNCNYHSDAYYCQPVKKRKGAALLRLEGNKTSM